MQNIDVIISPEKMLPIVNFRKFDFQKLIKTTVKKKIKHNVIEEISEDTFQELMTGDYNFFIE